MTEDKWVNKIICEIDDQTIEATIRLSPDVQEINYNLKSERLIEPLDAALCLWLIIKSMCGEVGISTDTFLRTYVDVDESKVQ
jgi:hypothetical protein